jgi:hypothetical protein
VAFFQTLTKLTLDLPIMYFHLKHKTLRTPFIVLLLILSVFVKAQQNKSDSALVGQRIIMLTGRGEVSFFNKNGIVQIKQVPNIVAPVARVEGNKVWILSPGEIEPSGWVDKSNVIVLTDAISYFASKLDINSEDWDAYFRKGDAEHALNKRDDAIIDYTSAIRLHPNDTYLYFRRARSYQARQMCDKAIADYGEVIKINPSSVIAADAYSRQAKLYSDCSDTLQRNPEKAIAAAEKAVALDSSYPSYLTLLASAYARGGQLENAITAQKKALASPDFPQGYREEAVKYLQQLEQMLLQKRQRP